MGSSRVLDVGIVGARWTVVFSFDSDEHLNA
jgi:hypothetical protein